MSTAKKARPWSCSFQFRAWISTVVFLGVFLTLGGTGKASENVDEPKRVVVCTESSAVHLGFGAKLALRLRERGITPELVVTAIAMLPIVELRGAVPVGINLLGMPWYRAVLFAVVGNLLPILFILFMLERLVAWLGRLPLLRRFFDWLFAHAKRRSGVIERYEFWGLVVFVGIPLPVTGAWTGSIAAVLLGFGYGRALLALTLGVLIAAAIVTALSLLGAWGALIALAVLAALAGNAVLSGRRRGKKGMADQRQ